MLQVENVSTAYGPIKALHEVSLHVERGEIVTLVGANGAGKSTLLMTIFGQPQPQSGRILFDGQDLTSKPTHIIGRLGLAQVPEGRRVFGKMTVLENLQMGEVSLGKRQGPTRPVDEVLQEVFTLFPRLQERSFQRAGTLSGGEQQMLAIGRALMSQPRMLMLDEPSLGLAPLIVKQIFEVISRIRDQGMTVFLVEQNANHALKLADRGYVLVNGVVKLSGSGRELLANPDVQKAYLGVD